MFLFLLRRSCLISRLICDGSIIQRQPDSDAHAEQSWAAPRSGQQILTGHEEGVRDA